MLLTPPFSYL